MIWKNYSHLRDSHAFLSPSKYHWLRYDETKLTDRYKKHSATILGTRYHKLAEELILLAVRLPDIPVAINMFVNDAIGFNMNPEVILYYSPNCYGTADAISWENGTLRVHDLKTGTSSASMDQLMVYAALFCLDYKVKSSELFETHLRIYQGEEIIVFDPTSREIFDVVKKIIEADKIINRIKEEGIL
jgi:hypothetical protein